MVQEKRPKPNRSEKVNKASVMAARRAKAVRLGWKPLDSIPGIDLKAALLKNDETCVKVPHSKPIQRK